jgi:hypothetical protein
MSSNEIHHDSIPLHPWMRGVAYALHHEDLSGARALNQMILERTPSSTISHYIEAQLAYGRRDWYLLALHLRYALAYGSRDQWLGEILGELLALCGHPDLATEAYALCGVGPTRSPRTLSTSEREQVKRGLWAPLDPLHEQTGRQREPSSPSSAVAPHKQGAPLRMTDEAEETAQSRENDVLSMWKGSLRFSAAAHTPTPEWLESPSSSLTPVPRDQNRPDWIEEGPRTNRDTPKISDSPPSWLSSGVGHESETDQERSFDLLQALSLAQTHALPASLSLALEINSPTLHQPQSTPRSLPGHFIFALDPKQLFLAKIDSQNAPWAFDVSDVASVRGGVKEIKVIFEDKRGITFYLSEYTAAEIHAITAHLVEWWSRHHRSAR